MEEQRSDPLAAEDIAALALEIADHAESMELAEGALVALLEHPAFEVRVNVLIGIASLARRFGRLTHGVSHPAVAAALADMSRAGRAQAEITAAELTQLLGWTFPRRRVWRARAGRSFVSAFATGLLVASCEMCRADPSRSADQILLHAAMLAVIVGIGGLIVLPNDRNY
jgi:hypothetical protein